LGRVRRALALLTASLALVASAGAAGPTTTFLLQPDPRLCPSPRCGGVWVQRVNHTRTRCLDGALALRCYVARVRGAPVTPGMLARGRLVQAGLDGFPGLAELRVVTSWRPALTAPRGTREAVFRVRDTGIRCVTTPCFSWRASALESSRTVALSAVDLRALDALPAARARVEAELVRGGALLAGTLATVPEPGRPRSGVELVVTQAWP
jgi:hypothetical protein